MCLDITSTKPRYSYKKRKFKIRRISKYRMPNIETNK